MIQRPNDPLIMNVIKKLHAFIIKTNKQINMKYVEYRIAAVRIEIVSYCSRFGGIVEYHIPALRIEIVS